MPGDGKRLHRRKEIVQEPQAKSSLCFYFSWKKGKHCSLDVTLYLLSLNP
jgi:hypothetical protein